MTDFFLHKYICGICDKYEVCACRPIDLEWQSSLSPGSDAAERRRSKKMKSSQTFQKISSFASDPIMRITPHYENSAEISYSHIWSLFWNISVQSQEIFVDIIFIKKKRLVNIILINKKKICHQEWERKHRLWGADNLFLPSVRTFDFLYFTLLSILSTFSQKYLKPEVSPSPVSSSSFLQLDFYQMQIFP